MAEEPPKLLAGECVLLAGLNRMITLANVYFLSLPWSGPKEVPSGELFYRPTSSQSKKDDDDVGQWH